MNILNNELQYILNNSINYYIQYRTNFDKNNKNNKIYPIISNNNKIGICYKYEEGFDYTKDNNCSKCIRNSEKKSNINIISKENTLENKLNELQRQLNEEKNKNYYLKKENESLKNKINYLNNDIKELKDKIMLLENNLIEKNNEIQKILIENDYINNNEITTFEKGEKIISVNFVSMGINDIGHFSLVCRKTDLFVRLEERLYQKFQQFKNYETYFVVNAKRIKRFKTIDENNIKSNDIINIFIVEEDEDNK